MRKSPQTETFCHGGRNFAGNRSWKTKIAFSRKHRTFSEPVSIPRGYPAFYAALFPAADLEST